MTGFFKKYNTGLKWVKHTLGLLLSELHQLRGRSFLYGRVCNTSWNVMSLLSNFMPPVPFYNPPKDKKIKGFFHV